MDEEQIEVVQRIRNERANLEERIKVAKLDLSEKNIFFLFDTKEMASISSDSFMH